MSTPVTVPNVPPVPNPPTGRINTSHAANRPRPHLHKQPWDAWDAYHLHRASGRGPPADHNPIHATERPPAPLSHRPEGIPALVTDRRPGHDKPRKHLTIADLCDELGIARSTFYDWRAKKTAPRCIELPNGELRIRRSDLEKWLTDLEEAA